MAPVSLKKTIQQYTSLAHSLEMKIQQLYSKREELESRAFVVIDETPVSSPENATKSVALALNQSTEVASSSQGHNIVGGSVNEPRSVEQRRKSPSSPPVLTTVFDANVEQDSALAAQHHAG